MTNKCIADKSFVKYIINYDTFNIYNELKKILNLKMLQRDAMVLY